MRWDALLPRLRHELAYRHPPNAVVLHLGENDLVIRKSIILIKTAIADLESVHATHPNIPIFWSELLPRLHWRGNIKPTRLNYTVEKINRAVRSATTHMGGRVVKHPNIKVYMKELFRPNGVHLSDLGNERWLSDIRHGLIDWLEDGKGAFQM
ncbi:Hypothetical predicted protein [Podarcis lilfordi]|uniref:SGNH hydrolase-type esterase domain-containing protein n=1 Tax=Podarcis lilfordi TaxID=74358 RepID=A0AA35K3B3_9SAUR|nr:Hypothetical predicted protein [Podarcis lilfordi]